MMRKTGLLKGLRQNPALPYRFGYAGMRRFGQFAEFCAARPKAYFSVRTYFAADCSHMRLCL
jgi:hypothetical protein